jgi:hypothetical protein
LEINAIFPVEVRGETAKSFNIVLGRHGGDGWEIDVRCAAPDAILLRDYEATKVTECDGVAAGTGAQATSAETNHPVLRILLAS